MNMGFWCGYVGVYPDHPWHGCHYGDVTPRPEVHGDELTYSAACAGRVCHVPRQDESSVWWLGFDCGHYLDFQPGIDASMRHHGIRTGPNPLPEEVYRDLEFVKAQCTGLARQAKAAA